MRLTMYKLTTYLLVICIAVLSGCSISDKKLSEFGKASDATVELVGLPSKVTSKLLKENEVTHNICNYLRGKKYELASLPKKKKSQLLTNQQGVANALASYSKAIAGVLDAEEQTKIEESGASFSGVAADLAITADFPSTMGPIVNVLVQAILAIEKNRRQEAVKAEMKKVIPYLQRLRMLIEQDEAQAISEMDGHIAMWERNAKCVLNVNRSKSNAQQLFREVDEYKRTLLADRKKATKSVSALDALIDAHFTIVFGETGDFDEGIDILNKFLTNINAIKDA